jgi:phytoene synthase
VIGRLLLEADRLYQLGSSGIANLPRDCRGAILAAATIYGEIGRVISDRGMNSVDDRAVVGSARKLTLLCLAKARAQFPHRLDTRPALASIEFLTTACRITPAKTPGSLPQRNFDERCEWVIDLFERLSTPGRQA